MRASKHVQHEAALFGKDRILQLYVNHRKPFTSSILKTIIHIIYKFVMVAARNSKIALRFALARTGF